MFVQNDRSGHGDARELRERIVADMRAHDVVADFVTPGDEEPIRTAVGRAARRALDTASTLVAVGGDGTINLAAAAAIEHALPLGIVPAGTFNFVARGHGIPEESEAALALLLDGEPRPTRTARLNERPFLVNASIGLYARLLQERETFKHRFGRSRAVASLAATFSALRPYHPMELTIRQGTRERRTEAATFIVGNNRLQLELVGVADRPHPGAHELSALLLHPVGHVTLLAMIWRGWRGEVAETRELESFLFERMEVDVPRRRARRITVATDGEIVRETLPLVFSIEKRPLMLIRPPRIAENRE